MTLDQLLDSLENVRARGGGYMACCPAHDDRTASLSIAEGEDGLLVKCMANCPTEAVMEAMGRTMRDLFPNNEPEAIYQYTDENGELLYEALRYPGKKFRQRRQDPVTREWISNLDGTRRVLYRLPEALRAVEHGQTVYVVEGEKDVHALEEISKTATCNPMGAGKWRDEYSEYLRGGKVIIIADRDKPGQEHAEAVRKSLDAAGVASRIVQAKEGKDISDHLEAGYAVEDLVPYSADVKRHYQPMDLFRVVPPVAWVVEHVVVAGEATLLVADGGAGKSFFALAMSLCVAGGEPFLGCDVQQGRVLYVDEEGSPDLALQRLYQLGATEEQKAQLDYLNFEGIDIIRHPDLLIEDALLVKPRLIVIDSHAKVTRVGEENSNNEMGMAWDEGFLPLARRSGAAVLVIHHTTKDGSSRGATQIRNSADQVLTMKRQPDGSQVVYPSKPRRLTNSLHFQYVDQGFGRYGLIPVVEETTPGWSEWSMA